MDGIVWRENLDEKYPFIFTTKVVERLNAVLVKMLPVQGLFKNHMQLEE